MRIYVGGKFGDKSIIRCVMTSLRDRGHEITHDWTRLSPAPDDFVGLGQCAEWDIDGVRQADAVVFLITDSDYPYRGTFCEVGAALYGRKTIVIVGPNTTAAARNCFWHHSSIHHYDTVEEMLADVQSPV